MFFDSESSEQSKVGVLGKAWLSPALQRHSPNKARAPSLLQAKGFNLFCRLQHYLQLDHLATPR